MAIKLSSKVEGFIRGYSAQKEVIQADMDRDYARSGLFGDDLAISIYLDWCNKKHEIAKRLEHTPEELLGARFYVWAHPIRCKNYHFPER